MAKRGAIALMFPGQGSQHVGMGAELYAAYPEARAVYGLADELLGFGLSKLCFEGPAPDLNDTANAQPAIVTTSLALWAAVRPRLNGAFERIGFVAGHSLGEFSALAAAGALSTGDAIRLVRRRGQAMQAAGKQTPGGMMVIIGLNDDEADQVASLASDDEGQCWVANYNSPGQVVIAGAQPALQRAMALAKARGAKRALALPVSVACHTAYMQEAAEALNEALDQTRFARPWAPVVSNVTAKPLQEPAEIKQALLEQLTSSVRWVESVRYLADQGVTEAMEIGPKAVVSGLVRRITDAIAVTEITDPQAVSLLAERVSL